MCMHMCMDIDIDMCMDMYMYMSCCHDMFKYSARVVCM